MSPGEVYCPRCGATMNHHADKLVYEADTDPPSSGVIEEFYQCPGCGAGGSRRESP